MGSKVNSYCLFNNYYGVLPILIRSHFAVFPRGWEMRIYHDKTMDNCKFGPMLLRLHKEGYLKAIFVNEQPIRCKAMLWRMIPIWDESVDYVFCKDADSVVTPRERKIMEEFISSRYSTLGINDNPSHTLQMMGGMIGFNTKAFIKRSGIHSFGNFMSFQNNSNIAWENHGQDQAYLARHIFPRIQGDMILYRTFPGAVSLNGCLNKLMVPEIDLDIHENIKKFGDRVMGYIGACGTVGPLAIELYEDLKKIGCNNPLDLFDLYGNQDVNKIMREEEEKMRSTA